MPVSSVHVRLDKVSDKPICFLLEGQRENENAIDYQVPFNMRGIQYLYKYMQEG